MVMGDFNARRVSVGVRRGRQIHASLVTLLVLFVQLSPALACAAFDGPEGPGCPAAFHSAPVAATSPANETERAPGDAGDDCSTGPAYLTIQLELPDGCTHGHSTWHWQSVRANDLRASTFDVVLGAAVLDATASRGRHAYLTTRRLRI